MINIIYTTIFLGILFYFYIKISISKLKTIETKYMVSNYISDIFQNLNITKPTIESLIITNNIFRSYYNTKVKKLFLPNDIENKTDILSIFIILHEIAHYIQDHESHNEYSKFIKYNSFKYLIFISFIAEFFILLRLESLSEYDLNASILISGILFSLGLTYEIFVVNRIENKANKMAFTMFKQYNNSNIKYINRLIKLLSVKYIFFNLLITLLYVLIILYIYSIYIVLK